MQPLAQGRMVWKKHHGKVCELSLEGAETPHPRGLATSGLGAHQQTGPLQPPWSPGQRALHFPADAQARLQGQSRKGSYRYNGGITRRGAPVKTPAVTGGCVCRASGGKVTGRLGARWEAGPLSEPLAGRRPLWMLRVRGLGSLGPCWDGSLSGCSEE